MSNLALQSKDLLVAAATGGVAVGSCLRKLLTQSGDGLGWSADSGQQGARWRMAETLLSSVRAASYSPRVVAISAIRSCWTVCAILAASCAWACHISTRSTPWAALVTAGQACHSHKPLQH